MKSYDKHAYHGNDADSVREAVRFPTAAISEVEDCIMSVPTWSSNPKRYDDYEDTRNV